MKLYSIQKTKTVDEVFAFREIYIAKMLSEDKVRDILFKLNMLGFEEDYDEKKDNLKSYLKGRRDAFKDVLNDGICDVSSNGGSSQ